jgi:hypothetical protein
MRNDEKSAESDGPIGEGKKCVWKRDEAAWSEPMG